MNEVLGTDRYGFERILMQLLIPGLVALGPFVWWLYRLHENSSSRVILFATENKELALFFVGMFAIIGGAVIEEIALRVENQWVDQVNSRWDPNVRSVWYSYLRASMGDEEAPSGLTAYYSSVVARFKFTMSLSFALVFSSLGVVCLIWSEMLSLAGMAVWVVPLALLGGAGYLLYESIDTARLLHDIRILTLQALGQIPTDYDDPSELTCPDNGKRYVLQISISNCCRTVRQFRVLDESKEFWLVEALERIPPKESGKVRTIIACEHIAVGDRFYYHPSILDHA